MVSMSVSVKYGWYVSMIAMMQVTYLIKKTFRILEDSRNIFNNILRYDK